MERGVVVVVEGAEGERGALVEEVDGADGDGDAGEPAVELGAVVAQAEVEGRPARDGVLVGAVALVGVGQVTVMPSLSRSTKAGSSWSEWT